MIEDIENEVNDEDFYASKKDKKKKPAEFNENFKNAFKKVTTCVVELLPPTVMGLVQVSITFQNKSYNKIPKNLNQQNK